ncbi:MAG: hypothetical protein HYS81_02680 [Candidatus Aenigmatarchaeota archaeon]|nr:MAG: hypothetical protein HYS81_02680 [Candidatus Aenigmarchaeota archaeon]
MRAAAGLFIDVFARKSAKRSEHVNSKGLSMIISHVLGLALMIAAFAVVSVGMLGYFTTVSHETQEAQASLVARAVAEEIVKMETLYRDSDTRPTQNNTNVTLADVYMDVPLRISGHAYSIEFFPRSDLWVVSNATINGLVETPLSEDRPYSKMRIQTEGSAAITLDYDIYNIFAKTEGSAGHTDRIRLRYTRSLLQGALTDSIILSGA